jgi:alpha-methylacyl-CoA racemase
MDLSGVTVLDLTRLLPGPYATQLLADLGARVIKVEDPNGGDYARALGSIAPDGYGSIFSAVNRGKESVALDLKDPDGVGALETLAADADVLIEGFRPGTVDRLGIGYDDIAAVNPEIVYCSLSGYGQTGVFSDRAGHDLNYAGVAGLLDVNRPDETSDPTIPGYPFADMAGGVFAALSVVGALLSRELGNSDGQYLDVSMTDALLSLSQAISAEATYGDGPRPGDTTLTGKFPCYDVYPTADERYVTLAALEPKFWRTLCEELGLEHLIDRHLSDDPSVREAVREELRSAFEDRTQAEWIADLGDEDVMVGPVNTPAEALSEEHVRERGLLVDGDDGPDRVGYPAVASGGLAQQRGPCPEVGEHTRSVLAELGVEQDRIERIAGGTKSGE